MIVKSAIRPSRFLGVVRPLWLAAGMGLVASGAAVGQEFEPETCSFGGIPLYGEVGIVERGGDISVEVVTSFPDLEVKPVESFPDDCGEWEFVESFPDFTINFVNSFPDLTIEFVESFPGVP